MREHEREDARPPELIAKELKMIEDLSVLKDRIEALMYEVTDELNRFEKAYDPSYKEWFDGTHSQDIARLLDRMEHHIRSAESAISLSHDSLCDFVRIWKQYLKEKEAWT